MIETTKALILGCVRPGAKARPWAGMCGHEFWQKPARAKRAFNQVRLRGTIGVWFAPSRRVGVDGAQRVAALPTIMACTASRILFTAGRR